MKLSYFAKVVLREVDSADSPYTFYVSTHGGFRDNGSSVVYFPPYLEVRSALNNAFGRGSDVYQIPGSVDIVLKNPDGVFDAYLPTGTTPQYWELSSFTLYEGDVTADGATLASMVKAFDGKIAPGSFGYSRGSEIIKFQAYDLIVEHNRQIVTEVWQDHTNYTSGTSTYDGLSSIPVVLGDFTTSKGTEKLPVRLIADGVVTAYQFAVCHHKIGTVTIYNETLSQDISIPTTGITADYDNGGFVINTSTVDAADYVIGNTLSVQCLGYPDDLTDENHVRLAEFCLTKFGTAVASATPSLSQIQNPVDAVSDDSRGSFEVLYNDTGGATPDYPARVYTTNTSLSAVNLANIILWEGNGKLAVSNNVYKAYWEIPLAATGASTIIADLEMPGSVNVQSDPDQEFATVYKTNYNLNPYTSTYSGYDDTSKTITSGVIFDRRAQYTSGGLPDVIVEYNNGAVYTAIAVTTSMQRRLLWAILIPQIANINLGVFAQDAAPMSLELYNDIILNSITYRLYGINKDVTNGSLTFKALVLDGLLQSGMWADANGDDQNGDAITTSKWANASDEDGSGNKVTSMWI